MFTALRNTNNEGKNDKIPNKAQNCDRISCTERKRAAPVP